MKKLIVAFIVVLLIGVVSYRACVNIRAKKEALSRKVPEKVVPVRVMQPRLREIFEKIRASGSLQARSEVLLVPKVSGKIIRNLVQMGSPVRKGDIVSVINRDEVGYEFKPYEIQSDGKGVVSRILLNPGASVNPATPIMAIVDIDTVKAVMAIDELKIRFVRVGLAVQLKMAAYPDDAFAAKVTAISPVANPQTRAIDIEITVPNPGYRLKPGMYAERKWSRAGTMGWCCPSPPSSTAAARNSYSASPRSGPLWCRCKPGPLPATRSRSSPACRKAKPSSPAAPTGWKTATG
jgi:multidrug efflux pump subunit AcrA (membrane-fusion protein)